MVSPASPRKPRRWLQFNLKTALVAMTLACTVVAFRQAFVVPFLHQRQAAADLIKLGAEVETRHASPAWLGAMVGHDNFQHVTMVKLESRPIADEDLAPLRRLPQIERLYLADTGVTDEGLSCLEGMTKLKRLSLWSTQISDEGLKRLSALPSLEVLDLHGAAVTDASADLLAGMPSLEEVNLKRTHFSAVGVARLRQLAPELEVRAPWPLPANPSELQPWSELLKLGARAYPHGQDDPRISVDFFRERPLTPEELSPLAQISHVHSLGFPRKNADDETLKVFAHLSDLTHLHLADTLVTDQGLKRLAQLRSLRYINLKGTPCTATGVAELKQSLPGCVIDW